MTLVYYESTGSKPTQHRWEKQDKVMELSVSRGGCGGQNGISKGYAATRALGLTKVPNIPGGRGGLYLKPTKL